LSFDVDYASVTNANNAVPVRAAERWRNVTVTTPTMEILKRRD
jgi:hypothetical protein